jgi:hypothetical protein
MNVGAMSGQHTPGPWSYWPGVAYPLGVITRDSSAGHVAVPSNCGEHTIANAHLIAAAPELLAKLESMVAVFNQPEIDPLVAFLAIEQARAAIRKARGQA